MDAGSAEIAGAFFLPTHMDAGSADNVWSNYLSVHPWT